ncbi:unnamed protein product [Cuscuta campestris]|uniref:RNase H type-1 domain-containing protein n=1 Tax=Cuscuta campestris TaxID=132261 RepID=A0A484L521_9ASTE|nr:unnamed protein product [Cuscuta campestris]
MGKNRSKRNKIDAKARTNLEGKEKLSSEDLRHQITLSQSRRETQDKSGERSFHSKAPKSSHPNYSQAAAEKFDANSPIVRKLIGWLNKEGEARSQGTGRETGQGEDEEVESQGRISVHKRMRKNASQRLGPRTEESGENSGGHGNEDAGDILKLRKEMEELKRQRLTPYFQAHPVRIMTDQPLGAVLRDPSSSGRVIKWAMVLSQYDISYQPRSGKKGQVIADFMVECTARGKPEEDGTGQERKRELWEVHSDGSCTKDGSGGGAVLTSSEGFKAYHSFKFTFRATNNEAEYEALIGGIQIALFMKIKHIRLKSDSKLAIGQLKGEMEAKEGRLKKYRDCARTLLGQFESYELIYVPREENEEADMLAKLCRTIPIHMEGMVRQRDRICPVWEEAVPVLEISGPGTTWMSPLITYLEKGELPVDPKEARRVQLMALKYQLDGEKLYKRTLGGPMLKCLSEREARRILEEVHQGVSSAHQGALTLARKVILQGFYWPTLKKDALELVRKCPTCQAFAPIPGRPSTFYTPVTTAIPFARWGTTPRRATGETPFALAYGFEAKVPTEVLVPRTRVEAYTPSLNEQLMEVDSHFTQERRDDASMKAEEYQRQSKRYHDKKTVLRAFEVGDWVLRKREKSQPTKGGKLAQNWEGPYRVEKVVRTGTYQLATSEGKALDNYWNVEHLKKFYQ